MTTSKPKLSVRTTRESIESRFSKNVAQSNDLECWEWQGGRNASDEYGIFHHTKTETMGAHRFSWILANGPIPKGMLVCHSCDNPLCVNPNHLFLGTQKDNMIDCWVKGRHNKTRDAHGTFIKAVS